MTTKPDSYVPIDRRALRELGRGVDRLGRAAVAQRAAVARLLELADDLRVDAIRRLRESGASEAQVERYEGAYRAQAGAVQRAEEGVGRAMAGLSRQVQELAEV